MDRASRTAELAALARASQTKEPEAIRGPDDLAIRFVSAPLRFIVNTEPLRKLVLSVMRRQMPGAYGYLIPRSKVFDEFVTRELDAGATQLVVLGAGYDSRAYRFRDRIVGRGARAFEVDAPLTSRRKRAKVEAIFGALPEHVTFVEVDFDRESMGDRLIAAGYDPTARSVFTWEGVSFYVSAAAVDAVLGFVATQSRAGSGIVFDYLFASVIDGTSRAFGAARTAAAVRKKGEPFTFGLDENTVAEFLSARGLALEANVFADALEARFLGEYAREITYRIGGFYGIATAHVRPHS